MDRRTPVLGGLLLGGLVIVWQLVAAGAGLEAVFPIGATAIEVVVLVGVLATTRREQGYGAQLGAGVLATVASLPLVAAGFLLTVFVVFPDAIDASEVPAQGLAGLIGTAITGVVVSALAAIGLRRR